MIDLCAFRYVYNYRIAEAVPLNASVSYEELAAKTGVAAGQLRQMLRQIMLIHVFCEPKRGYVAHTATSKLLLDPGIKGWNGWISEDLFPVSIHQIDALNKWGHGSPEPNQSAFQKAFNTDLGMFPYYETVPARKERLARLLQSAGRDPHHHVNHLTSGYDWSALGPVTVVDVGGNMGHCSVAIANAAPEIKCIVQDLPQLIKVAQDPEYNVVPDHLKPRVTLMGHNFFDPQPEHVSREADVYFIRNVLHNWSTPYCRKIIGNVVSAMEMDNRPKKLIVQDEILPPVGSIAMPTERVMRSMDGGASLLLNAQSRDMEEWEDLLKSVDQRLKIVSVSHPIGAASGIIETIFYREPVQNGSVATAGEQKEAVNGVHQVAASEPVHDAVTKAPETADAQLATSAVQPPESVGATTMPKSDDKTSTVAVPSSESAPPPVTAHDQATTTATTSEPAPAPVYTDEQASTTATTIPPSESASTPAPPNGESTSATFNPSHTRVDSKLDPVETTTPPKPKPDTLTSEPSATGLESTIPPASTAEAPPAAPAAANAAVVSDPSPEKAAAAATTDDITLPKSTVPVPAGGEIATTPAAAPAASALEVEGSHHDAVHQASVEDG